MHVDQRRRTPQGNFTILPTEVVNLLTETGPGVMSDPPHPLSAVPGISGKAWHTVSCTRMRFLARLCRQNRDKRAGIN